MKPEVFLQPTGKVDVLLSDLARVHGRQLPPEVAKPFPLEEQRVPNDVHPLRLLVGHIAAQALQRVCTLGT